MFTSCWLGTLCIAELWKISLAITCLSTGVSSASAIQCPSTVAEPPPPNACSCIHLGHNAGRPCARPIALVTLCSQASTSRIVSASAFRALLVHYGMELQQKHADSVGRAAPSGDEPQSADLGGIAALDLAKGLNILQASANDPKTHPCKKAHGDLSKHLVDLAEKDGCEEVCTSTILQHSDRQ